LEFDNSPISNTLTYRGCGIRVASYEVEPTRWQPEACMWVQTENGSRRIWVHSFAHCFAAEHLTFANKLDADNWALEAAKSIIDRGFEPLDSSAENQPRKEANYLSRAFDLTRRSFFALRRSKSNG